jgi:hypothetical protein
MTTRRQRKITSEQLDENTLAAVDPSSLPSEAPGQVQEDVPGLEMQEAKASRPRKRKPPDPQEPISLDPAYVMQPERMQYALLLALLLRQNATAKFSKKDMDHVDTDYNILFARTLDGQHLEVTVVSAESGIIRSPENQKQVEQWQHEKEQQEASKAIYQPLPPSPPLPEGMPQVQLPPELANHPAAAFFQLHAQSTPRGVAQPAPPATVFQPGQNQETPQATVVQFPPQNPTQPTDGSKPYHFPFQVGDKPEMAQGIGNLDQLQARLMQKDQQLAAEEAAALQRMEQELAGPS